MDREQALTEMLDREQIRELATRYSFAADSRDYDTLVELFDTEVDNGRWGTGRESTRAYYEQLLGKPDDGRTGMVAHLISNHQIDFIDDSHAEGMCYVRATAGFGKGWTEIVALYLDEYIKRDGRWYFVRRQPCDLQRFSTEGPRSIGKLSLADAWEENRARQARRRGHGGD